MVTKYRESEAGSCGMPKPLSQSKAGLHCNPEVVCKAVQVWKPSTNKQTMLAHGHLVPRNHLVGWTKPYMLPVIFKSIISSLWNTRDQTQDLRHAKSSSTELHLEPSVNCKWGWCFTVLASYLWASSVLDAWLPFPTQRSLSPAVGVLQWHSWLVHSPLVAISAEVQVYSGFK